MNISEFEDAFERVNRTAEAAALRGAGGPNFNSTKMINDSRFNLTKLAWEQSWENSDDWLTTIKSISKMEDAGRNTSMDAWKNSILSTSEYGEPFLRFTLSAIIISGAFLKVIYQSYGMAGLPILLIKGTKSLETEKTEIKTTIQAVRD